MTGSRGMWLRAREHGDRYLLPRVHGSYQRPLIYQAADWLVWNGYAKWIPSWSTFAPGIELTGKPWR
jgi:hypothetical protein